MALNDIYHPRLYLSLSLVRERAGVREYQISERLR